MNKSIFAIVCVAVICGCQTAQQKPKVQYIEQGTVIAGRASSATMYDLESAANDLLMKMRVSKVFERNYNNIKLREGGKPIIDFGNIENMTTSRIQGRLDSLRDTIRVSLMEMDLFESKDIQSFGDMSDRMLSSETNGLEDGSLVESMGTHKSPSLMFKGDLRQFEDEGEEGTHHTYKLRLALYDLKTGRVVWEGIETKIKL